LFGVLFTEDFVKKPGAKITSYSKKRKITKNDAFMNPVGE
jgi:hypothetical protein